MRLKNGRSSKFSVGRQRGAIAYETDLFSPPQGNAVAIDAGAERDPQLLAQQRHLSIDLRATAAERTVVHAAR